MTAATVASAPPAADPRSWLFVPADRERMIARSVDTGADALIFDLEDAVVAERRPLARGLLSELLTEQSSGTPRWVRINPLDTPDALIDLAAVVRSGIAGVVLPKIRAASDLSRLDAYLSALEVREGLTPSTVAITVVATETPDIMFRLGDLAGVTPRLTALTWGAEDLSTAIGASTNINDGRWDRPYELAMSMCLFAAAAAGVQAVDTLYADFNDEPGLIAATRVAASRGFTGKIAIHPRQVAAINTAMTPSPAEIDAARAVVAAFAADPVAGSVSLDGRMLDRPHLSQALRVLRRAGRADPQ